MSERVCAVCAADGATVCSCDKPMTSPAIPSPKGETQLENCPFCGGIASRQDLTDDDNAGGSCITCDSYGASSPVHFDRKENLYDSWNRRSASSREEVRREALEEAAKVADEVAADEREEKMADKEAEGEDYDPYSYGAGWSDGSWVTAQNIAKAIRALSQGE